MTKKNLFCCRNIVNRESLFGDPAGCDNLQDDGSCLVDGQPCATDEYVHPENVLESISAGRYDDQVLARAKAVAESEPANILVVTKDSIHPRMRLVTTIDGQKLVEYYFDKNYSHVEAHYMLPGYSFEMPHYSFGVSEQTFLLEMTKIISSAMQRQFGIPEVPKEEGASHDGC